jgi:hypothetical protein
MGLVEIPDVVEWADRLITVCDQVPAWVIDVSLAANERAEVVEQKLRDSLSDAADMTPAYTAMRLFANEFRSGKFAAADAAHRLKLWADNVKVPQDAWTMAMTPSWIVEDARYGVFPEYDLLASIKQCLEHFDSDKA